MVHGEISICEFTAASITSLKITADWFRFEHGIAQ